MALPSNCPLCGAAHSRQSVVTGRVYGDQARRAVFHCGACDVRYLYPGLSPKEEEHFYASEFESFMVARSAAGAGWEGPKKHIEANEVNRQRRMGHLQGTLKPASRILEVGCSSGFMLYPLAEAGHKCFGVEPSGIFADYVREKSVPCFASIQELNQSGLAAEKFDLILHYYVMEHVADAQKFLRDQLALLRPGGTILFEVPNANDALSTIYDIAAYERFIWVVSHRWYFSETSLKQLFTLAGGKGTVRLDQRYDLSNHMVWARDGRPGGMQRFTPKLGSEIEEAYRLALIESGNCDTLIGILQA